MPFAVNPMREEQARLLVAWRYEGMDARYNMSPEDYDEVMSGAYYAVTDDHDDLIGFFSFGPPAQVPGGHIAGAYAEENALDVGLGLRPDLTGRGMGKDFLKAGCAFAQRQFAPAVLRLSVITINRRAIRLYENAGFQVGPRFLSATPSGDTEFLLMTKE